MLVDRVTVGVSLTGSLTEPYTVDPPLETISTRLIAQMRNTMRRAEGLIGNHTRRMYQRQGERRLHRLQCRK